MLAVCSRCSCNSRTWKIREIAFVPHLVLDPSTLLATVATHIRQCTVLYLKLLYSYLSSPLFSLRRIICCAANEGPVRIQYKYLTPIYVFQEINLLFPKQNYNVLSPSSYTYISERDLYISRIGLPILLQEIFGLILGKYKSPKDTWMWKLALRPRNSQKRNT
jgi:hypothetical protein